MGVNVCTILSVSFFYTVPVLFLHWQRNVQIALDKWFYFMILHGHDINYLFIADVLQKSVLEKQRKQYEVNKSISSCHIYLRFLAVFCHRM